MWGQYKTRKWSNECAHLCVGTTMAALTRKQMKIMVRATRTHDERYMRTYEAGTFITVPAIERLIIEQDDKCFYCTGPFDHEAPDRTWPDAPTLERLDESLAHTIDNCVLACRYCNGSRHGKTVAEMKEYGMCMKLGWIKYCPTCKTFFEDPEVMFCASRTTLDGLNSACRSCISSRKKTYRAARKLKKLALE